MNEVIENNQVLVIGEVISDFTFNHEIFGERLYMFVIKVKRLSEAVDIIPIMVSERLIDVKKDYQGMNVSVSGQFRSYNTREEGRNRLVLCVFAREIEFVDIVDDNTKTNQIFLDGYICKVPIYRKTPMGREMTDLLIAVNRAYGKSDYIPCICWGRNARFTSNFEVGKNIKILGRTQSREYVKKIDEENSEKRIAYEVSVNEIRLD